MRLACCAAALVLLALPQLAAAGPVEWSIRGGVDPSRVGTEFYLGAYERQLLDNQTEPVWIYAQMPEGLISLGNGSLIYNNVGVLSKFAYRYDKLPPTNPDELSNEVPFDVWVTDDASGETGHLSFSLAAFLLTGLPQTDYNEVVFGGETSKSFVLGGNRYDVQVETGDSEDNTWVYADVTVTPGTPEPGTLALAGLGLGGLGLVRRLRQK